MTSPITKYLSVLLVFAFTAPTLVAQDVAFWTRGISPRGTTTTEGAVFVTGIDLDEDGDTDVLSSSYEGDKISWHKNTCGAQCAAHPFFTQIDITTNVDGPTWIFVIDLDEDTDLDVLTTSSIDDKVAWYENDGNESFTTHVITTIFGSASGVVGVDLDEDGDTDIIASARVGDRVTWFENDGNENFNVRDLATDWEGSRMVDVIDLDEDGDLDIVSASWGEEVTWFENDGEENFTRHEIVESEWGSGSIHVIDIDNDGDLDIFSAAGNSDVIGWLENDGDENFTFHVIRTDSKFPDTVFGIDFDLDGDIDLLTAALDSDEIAWHENCLITCKTGVATEENVVPNAFTLFQNAPNPFHGRTDIRFALSRLSHVQLTVYNVIGQEVARLVDRQFGAASHEVSWNASGVPTGLYFYTLKAGSFSETRTMVLVK